MGNCQMNTACQIQNLTQQSALPQAGESAPWSVAMVFIPGNVDPSNNMGS